jgi:hypothetical protein
MTRPSIPPRRKITPKDIKRSIQQAQNLCYNFEDTPACRSAWEKVDELSTALDRQRERELLKKNLDEMCIEEDPWSGANWDSSGSPEACKEYDL